MLGWFAFMWLSPGPAPYHYRLVEEGGIDKFSKLGLDAWPDLGISKQEIRVEGVDEPVAVAYLARRGNSKPVMLAWENYTGDPLIFVDSKLSELTLFAALDWGRNGVHLPSQWTSYHAVVLATANRGDREIRTRVLGLYGKRRGEGEIPTLC